MPLRPTEIQFLDDQTVVCPTCSRQRPAAQTSCPDCGSRGVLQSLSLHTANFHISSLFLLTTLIAFCFALARIALWLAVPASMIAALATLRTWLLAQERKRHRYPTSPADLIRLFGWSVLGIIIAILVFGGTCFALQLPLGLLLGGIAMHSEVIAVVLLVLAVIASESAAVALFVRRRASRVKLLVGAAPAFGSGLLILSCTAWVVSYEIVHLLMLLLFTGVLLAAVWLGCRRNGGSDVRAFVVGCSIGICTLGAAALLPLNWWMREAGMYLFVLGGVFLWPALVSIVTLEKIWSWDDAFPAIASQPPNYPHSRTRWLPPEISIDDDEGNELGGLSS